MQNLTPEEIQYLEAQRARAQYSAGLHRGFVDGMLVGVWLCLLVAAVAGLIWVAIP